MSGKPKLERFKEEVLSKFQIYNGIFITLPFDEISNTGVLLPLFSEVCEKGYQKNQNPSEIVDAFFKKYAHNLTNKQKTDLLYRFIQYIERQVVLFDAIEDAAFRVVNNMDGVGTLRSSKEEAQTKNKFKEFCDYLQQIKIRPVLTAHPTQFYPGSVLAIINDLSQAIRTNDLLLIKKLLAQLGKTPFYKKEKPTPYNEAVSLIWFLENVFYHAVSNIYNYVHRNILKPENHLQSELVTLGFWPGGDRDGNPFVTTEITLKVAKRLQITLLKNYYRDVRRLRRRITFKTVDELINKLEVQLYNNIFTENKAQKVEPEKMYATLKKIKQILITDHQSLFVNLVTDLMDKVAVFGIHFAGLDIRQDSRVHHKVILNIKEESTKMGLDIFPQNYEALSDSEKIKTLTKVKGTLDPEIFKDEITRRTLESIVAMKQIQKRNGEKGSNRYIISNNQTAVNVLEVFALLRLSNWVTPTVDIVPLFETIDDLERAESVMDILYANKTYAAHLKQRGQKQTFMLGFSDGTKDGGYLMANWSIFKAKEALTRVSNKYGISIVFFDGRGGPPARGGGKTHQFYASLGPTISGEEIQLTVQGQTISSKFGTLDSCQYNLEQLLSSGIANKVFQNEHTAMSNELRETMDRLAETSHKAYENFKQHPKFLPYLEQMSTLKYYARTNIGSRPSKRGKSDTLNFSDLRAIPFVGSWSQLKQNVPGFFGVGTAMLHFKENNEFDKVIALYKNSGFFRALLENSMMSLTKSFFPLTAYMSEDAEYGDFWKLIYKEYELSHKLILEVTGYSELMEDAQAMRASIKKREQIVLPLLTIQQFALRKIQELKKSQKTDLKEQSIYENMVTRSLFGNINASRNSA